MIPVATRAYRVRVACGYCAVFKGRREGDVPAERRGGRPAGAGLSKLNSMLGLQLGAMPRGPGQVRSTY